MRTRQGAAVAAAVARVDLLEVNAAVLEVQRAFKKVLNFDIGTPRIELSDSLTTEVTYVPGQHLLRVNPLTLDYDLNTMVASTMAYIYLEKFGIASIHTKRAIADIVGAVVSAAIDNPQVTGEKVARRICGIVDYRLTKLERALDSLDIHIAQSYRESRQQGPNFVCRLNERELDIMISSFLNSATAGLHNVGILLQHGSLNETLLKDGQLLANLLQGKFTGHERKSAVKEFGLQKRLSDREGIKWMELRFTSDKVEGEERKKLARILAHCRLARGEIAFHRSVLKHLELVMLPALPGARN